MNTEIIHTQNGLSIEAEFMHEHLGIKMFMCQDRITCTDQENKVIAAYDLHEVLGMPTINKKRLMYEDYLELFNKVYREDPWCFGSRASAAHEVGHRYGNEYHNIDDLIERHRQSIPKLWNYTGD